MIAACGPLFPAISAKPQTAELGLGAARSDKRTRGGEKTGCSAAALSASTPPSIRTAADLRNDVAAFIIAVRSASLRFYRNPQINQRIFASPLDWSLQ
jgi:hypothetical protein